MNRQWITLVAGLGLGVAGLWWAAPALAGPAPATAGVITVTTTQDELLTNSQCSLREAVTAVNLGAAVDACAAGDVIQLTAGLTYTLSITGTEEDANASGDLDLLAPVTITVSGGRAVIAAQGLSSRVLEAHMEAGAVRLEAITLTGGNFVTSGAGYGGGLRNEAGLTLVRVDVIDNRAAFGGGIFNDSGATLTMDASLVLSNTAASQGGGVYNYGTLTITSSSLVSNTSPYAGGLDNELLGRAFLRNVTVSGNVVDGEGGGIYNDGLVLTLNNVTISRNQTALQGGGLFTTKNTVAAANTLIAGNTATSLADCAGAGALDSKGYNVLGSGCTVSEGTSRAVTDPGLGTLADNGGRTPTLALLANSPAVDAGNPATPAGGYTCEPADQRGVPRLGRCDVGAFDLGREPQVFLPLILRQP